MAAVDEIATQMDSVEGGMEPAAGQAVAVAIEHFCRKHNAIEKKIAFEEYSTRRNKEQQAVVALEGIRDTLRRIWQKILAMLKAIIGWFKEVFNRQRLRRAALDNKHQRLGEKIKTVKAAAVTQDREPPKPGKLRAPNVVRVLNVRGSVPEGIKLVQMAYDHNQKLQHAYKAFGESEERVLVSIEKAVSRIYKEGQAFRDALNSGFQEIVSLPITMPRSRDQHRFGELSKGMIVFESPLVFGNRSIFRTGLEAESTMGPADVHCGVFSSSDAPSATSFDTDIDKLKPEEVDIIYELYKEHGNKFAKVQEERRHNAIKKLETLESQMHSIERNPGNQPFVTNRGRQIHQLIAMTKKLMSSDDVSIVVYDQAVQNALLDYAIASCI